MNGSVPNRPVVGSWDARMSGTWSSRSDHSGDMGDEGSRDRPPTGPVLGSGPTPELNNPCQIVQHTASVGDDPLFVHTVRKAPTMLRAHHSPSSVGRGLLVGAVGVMLAVGSTVGLTASPAHADDTGDDAAPTLIPADPSVPEVIAGFAPDGCTDPQLPITHEEARLTATLPSADDPSVPADRTFARTMVEGGGFDGYTRSFAHQVCRSGTLEAATRTVTRLGE